MPSFCLWLARHWPWTPYNRIAWRAQLWLIGKGSDAYMRELGYLAPQQWRQPTSVGDWNLRR